MIYLDTAATSFRKPPSVYKTLMVMTKKLSANAGHGASTLSLAAAEKVYEAAEQAAMLFNISSPENIAFTQNTTLALNMAVKGVSKPGNHIIITSMEHNSLARPVYACSSQYSIVKANQSGFVSVSDIENAIKENTSLIAMTHASNVCGSIQNIKEIGSMCKRRGILFLVDAAQSAGVIDIDVARDNIDMLAFAGHKSLMGPLGTGGLYVRDGIMLDTIIEGGSGSSSEKESQPEFMPDRLVSGTINMPAIAALGEGIKFVRSVGTGTILDHEQFLRKIFIEKISQIKGLTVYTPEENCVGVVSVNLEGKSCVEAAEVLDREYKIAVRAGLHCSPLAHKTLSTFDLGGTLRFSFGYYTSVREIDYAANALNKICKNML